MAAILIVDDDIELRNWMRTVLEEAGHTVAEASNGAEALEYIKVARFDLIITDIVMPGVTGIELIRALAVHDSTPPILAISGGDTQLSSHLGLTAAEALGAGMVLYRPHTANELLDAVNSLLGR